MSQSILDDPHILAYLFHPRRNDLTNLPAGVSSVAVIVEQDVQVGGRLYAAQRESPLILYFHGNGEIAGDYDDLAPLYTQMGISLLVMDYRGYGTSNGTPTASNLGGDALVIFRALDGICASHGLTPVRRYLMGRSLGSAAAIEIASKVGNEIAGLIIESGFANTFPLLERLGLHVEGADEERDGAGNLTKIRQVSAPTLIIHGEVDTLIPVSDAEALYANSAAPDKKLVRIPGGAHNNVMIVNIRKYFGAIQQFCLK